MFREQVRTREEAVRQIELAAEGKLMELRLWGLELEELLPEIAKCTHLVELWLSGNQITYIPEGFGQLSNLR